MNEETLKAMFQPMEDALRIGFVALLAKESDAENIEDRLDKQQLHNDLFEQSVWRILGYGQTEAETKAYCVPHELDAIKKRLDAIEALRPKDAALGFIRASYPLCALCGALMHGKMTVWNEQDGSTSFVSCGLCKKSAVEGPE